MNLTPYILGVIEILPKVVPVLRELRGMLKNDDDKLVSGLTLIKQGVKVATIALLETKEIVESTPSDTDNIKFDKGVEALRQIRDNITEVLNVCDKSRIIKDEVLKSVS